MTDGPEAPAAPAAESADPVVAAAEPGIRRRLAELLAQHRLPGASVSVVREQTLAWTAGFGFADLETGRRPDADTVYRVASISKTFTAAAVVQLRDRGRLTLDDPLVRHLPEFGAVRVHHGRVEDVTLRRLLSHRSGLVSEGPFAYWDTRQFPDLDEVLAALPRTEVVLAPDAGAKYSNLAFALLGEVVARLSGEPFPDYARRHLFAPLGMDSSSFRPDEALLARMAVGYEPHPFEDRPQPAGHTPARGLAAAAGLYTTAADLARWLGLQLTAAPSAVGAARPDRGRGGARSRGRGGPALARRDAHPPGDRRRLDGGALPGLVRPAPRGDGRHRARRVDARLHLRDPVPPGRAARASSC